MSLCGEGVDSNFGGDRANMRLAPLAQVALEHQIEERPFISVLVAFGIGLVLGKLINR